MSNELGEIYGTVKDGKGSIIINSNTIDICGNLLMNGLISLCSSNEEVAAADPSGILNRINSLTNNVNILDNSVNNLDNSVNSLLTSNNDASFGNVDVSGTLNVQGEKVITVPSLDICGNDLSANTTYEITTGPAGNINNISFKLPKTKVYFSVQLGNGAQSHGTSTSHYRYFNHLNELQSNVRSDTRGLAEYSDTWDINGMLSSGGNDQTSFATNGYVVPRDGVYKIDCYQTIRSMISNSALSGLRVYRNPTVSTTTYYQDSQCLAATDESESGDGNPPRRSESLVWLGQLNQGDVIKFMITCDNGFGPQTGLWKGCYTIMSVD